MNEEFLHYIWQHKLYKPELTTVAGEQMEVIHPGTRNTDGGPDFFNAKIKIDDTLWAGNVEIHQNEKEWYEHQHHKDSTYNNVILHVVEQHTSSTLNSKEREIPVCQIEISPELRNNYQQLYFNESWIPCADAISAVQDFTLHQWIDRLLIEKLQEKSLLIESLLEESNNNWDQVFFVLLCRSFGFGINGLPFELMARQTPFNTILKHADNLFQVEAILFGQAGFLANAMTDNYSIALKKEYEFLRKKYNFKPIEQHLWKFLRLRPANFPTIRLAQLAQLIVYTKGCFDTLLNLQNKKHPLTLIDITVSDYWKNHYRLNTQSSNSSNKTLGKPSRLRIIYNTIIPYLFIYSAKHHNEVQKEKIIDYLYQQPAEKNIIIDKWAELGIISENEAQAQALIYLKKTYCNNKKCLSCRIGHEVLCKR
ncbi:DUF2851 family protein [Carboxylicivirga sp. A043]|uniref:DUF2851 family protein n=1 Tax=Carboxylicivirga litoralis TaxID=2816963 RepID=UPI0021CB7C46|nr:DUF2851 family protein [Carboxylicivirga sp. A043]MCU4154592.1 DUF2851 family protein [Carboxylicivirga sp. A043]